ncbi:MAG TPA: DUF6460 domain-containing protein [Methylocella sp.]|nr:DUF6460 domain-containing protein [Methylocella sp.]
MTGNEQPSPKALPPWPQGGSGSAQSQEPAAAPSQETALYRFLGGAPGPVFLRLLFVSLIVGAFLMWLDIRPLDIFHAITSLIDRIWALGFDAIREIFDYIFAGAAIVVPVWLVLRLLNMRSAR